MMTRTDIPIAVNPRRSIGGVFPQIVVEETHADALRITDHPVESGASISDHAFAMPETVTITAAASATHGDIRAVYEKLLELQRAREPFDVVTGKRAYTDMLVERLSVKTDKERENVLWFSAACKKIRIVGVKEAALAPRGNQALERSTAGPVDAGRKSPVAVDAAGGWR